MADDPLASFALGSFAASRGASDLAALSVSLFAPKNDVVSLADFQALAIQHAEVLNQVAELQADTAMWKRNYNRLEVWADKVHAELMALKSR